MNAGDVSRTHDGEVAMVECRDLGCFQPLSDRNHDGIDGSEPKVDVSLDEIGGASEIVAGDVPRASRPAREAAKESASTSLLAQGQGGSRPLG